MAEDVIYYRETSNAQISFQLLADNVPIDLTAVNKVEIVLVPDNGTGSAVKYNTTSNPTVITVLSATLGKIGYTPQASDLTYAHSPVKVYFNVYTSASNKYAVPDKGEISVQVTQGW